MVSDAIFWDGEDWFGVEFGDEAKSSDLAMLSWRVSQGIQVKMLSKQLEIHVWHLGEWCKLWSHQHTASATELNVITV